MKHPPKYYMLVASLPHLPKIGQVGERIPMNRAQMEKRFKALSEEDYATVETAWKFMAWEEQDAKQSDADIVAAYQKLLVEDVDPVLQQVMEFRMSLRTIMAGLRRRHRGQMTAPTDLNWGTAPWNRHIQQHWNDLDFKLGAVFPWIGELRKDIEEGNALLVEERVMNLVWESLDRLCMGKSFSFELVIAFLFKWDILDRWLKQDVAGAEQTLERLTDALIEQLNQANNKQLSA